VPNELHIPPDTYEQIRRHLLKDTTEQVVFAFADVTATEEGVLFSAAEVYCVQAHETQFQSGYHISLTDDCLARVIKVAWDKQAALVDFHSHLSDLYPAQFSPSDLYGFREFVPHIWWRLRHKPLLAMVMNPSGFDALVWRTSPDAPEALAALRIGEDVKAPTGLTLKVLERSRG